MKRKLQVSVIIALYQSLGALDGFQKAVGEKVAFVPYKFTDETRRAIVKNRRVLKAHVEEHDDRNLALIKDVAADPDGSPEEAPAYIDKKDEARMATYNERYRKIEREEVEVELVPIAESALLAENKNPIPGSVLEALWPLTEPEPAPKVAEPVGGE